MQILAPETPDLRLGLVKYLSGVPHAEATRRSPGLAIFSAEEEVRRPRWRHSRSAASATTRTCC